MSERDRIARALPGGVVAALTAQSRVGATGTLLVTGDPGGLLRLYDGRVSGAESPGAPGVEALLLRSGRILESSWVAAYQAGALHGRPAIEPVRRGLFGVAELETVCLMALFDAAFAIAAVTVEASRLLADGLLRLGPPRREGGELRALLAPRHAAPPGLQPRVPPPATGPVPMPRRPSRASGS